MKSDYSVTKMTLKNHVEKMWKNISNAVKFSYPHACFVISRENIEKIHLLFDKGVILESLEMFLCCIKTEHFKF